MKHLVLARSGIALGLLLMFGSPTVAQAAFTYSVNVVGDDVVGSGSITLPTDSGSDATGVALDLDVTMFGNAVTFTEAEISDIQWQGADPGDLNPLVFNPLSLLILGPPLLALSDNFGGQGDASCSDTGTGCNGGDAAATEVTWSYQSSQAQVPVPEPSTMALLLAGVGVLAVGRLPGRTSRGPA